MCTCEQLLDLHQRVYNNEVLLADKHAEILMCYKNMADKHKEYASMQAQIAQLRKDLATEVYSRPRKQEVWIDTGNA